ncbi:Detected protein of unknown function [Hibiscus syriacus]|uniref:RNA-directed DNA polymerase n=1 Tax=Hibiscus syriacus TaxID=106335 RepID=A0A6A3CAL3_HIBSY|nr:Detected protein of unknown function [Hibiscus syriacus]
MARNSNESTVAEERGREAAPTNKNKKRDQSKARESAFLEPMVAEFGERLERVQHDFKTLENVVYEARKKLRELKQRGIMRDYVKEFTTLMLQIPNMSEEDLLFYFIDGLQGWAKQEMHRRDIRTVDEAIVIVESLVDFQPYSHTNAAKNKDKYPARGGGERQENNQGNRDRVHRRPQAKEGDRDRRPGRRKYEEKKKAFVPKGGCFLCKGPHPMSSCPKLGSLSAIVDRQDTEFQAEMGSLQVLNALKAKSLTPTPSNGLMYVEVVINEKLTRAMVDTGTTHNFVSKDETNSLGLKYTGAQNGSRRSVCILEKGSPCMIPTVEAPKGQDRDATQLSAIQLGKGVKKWDITYLAMLKEDDEIEKTDDLPLIIREVLDENKDVMTPELPNKLPPRREVDHKIELEPGAKPPALAPYRMAPPKLEELRRQLKELVDMGMIRPSKAQYGAPVLFQKKHDESLRMCVDYRALNNVTIKNRYPIPLIVDLFDRLGGAKVYTKMDLQKGYYQVRITEGDEPKTACITRFGSYEWLVMPFGLTNAPATFCTLMNKLFQPYLDQFMVVYLDDIVVYSNSMEEHIDHLRIVFKILRENELYVKKEKCTFSTEEVHFLGHVICHGKLLMDESKIKAITEWEPPTKAFEDLKAAVSQEPVLALPDFTMPFEVHTDASDFAIGGVLMQEGHPIAFESRKLNDTERRYTVQENEMTVIIHCLRVWRHYLLGAHFTIKTDNVATSYFQTQKKLSPKQVRWQDFLAEFDYTLEYKPGKANVVADALSRKTELDAISLAKGTVLKCIKEGLELDPLTRELVKLASDGKTQRFWVGDGLLYTKGRRIYVPKWDNLRRDLIKECHDTKWAGHLGQKRTMSLLETAYFWPHMKDSVELYVKTCLVRQQDKVENRQPVGLLEPLPVPQRPWDSITLDFISALPKSEGYGSIMVVVDRFSKYGTFIPCPKDCTAEEAARAFFKNVVKHWGLPRSIISDRDPRFTGHLWTELFKLLGTELNFSTSFHPQTDGQTERVNALLECYLRHFVSANQRDWAKLLDVAQFSYNLQRSEATGRSPFELATGQQPLTPYTLTMPLDEGKSPGAAKMAKLWEENADIARACLEKARKKMKKWADEKRRHREFSIGDLVLVKLLPQQFKALQSIHPVFHVSMLKPYHTDKEDASRGYSHRAPPIVTKSYDKEVETVLTSRTVRKRGVPPRTEYLIKWKGLPESEATWELAEYLWQFEEHLKAFEATRTTSE